MDLLKSNIIEFQQRDIPASFKRNVSVNTSLPIIITLIGARRSGKTYLLYQVMSELVSISRQETERLYFVSMKSRRSKLGKGYSQHFR